MLKLEWSGGRAITVVANHLPSPISLSLVKPRDCVPAELQGRFIPFGIGLLKGKNNSKKSGKRISQIIVRQRKGTFFGKEVLRKCAKNNAGRKNRKCINYVN
jgi:hypothetical protein